MQELFTVLPPAEAFTTLARACSPNERVEIVPLEAAPGRVLAADVTAAETLPAFARATMDGYAVRSADSAGASEQSPAYLRLAGDVPTGVVPDARVHDGEAVRIHTGAMLPQGADAVVMVEETNLHAAAGGPQPRWKCSRPSRWARTCSRSARTCAPVRPRFPPGGACVPPTPAASRRWGS